MIKLSIGDIIKFKFKNNDENYITYKGIYAGNVKVLNNNSFVKGFFVAVMLDMPTIINFDNNNVLIESIAKTRLPKGHSQILREYVKEDILIQKDIIENKKIENTITKNLKLKYSNISNREYSTPQIIEVNKNCYISENNYFPIEMRGRFTHGLSISAVDDSIGFIHFVFAFDENQQCCEDFKFEVSEFNSGIYFVKNILINDCQNNGSVSVIINIHKTKNIELSCLNAHNGYYCHEVSWEVLYLDDNNKTTIHSDYSEI